MDISNKVVFVTGSGRGIGKALVNQALIAGARKVYAAVRNTDTTTPWDGSRVVPVRLDLHDTELIQSAARAAQDVDILINNAGTLTSGKLLELSEADLRKDMDTNLFGTLRVVRAFAPILAQKKESAIVNITSIVALAGIGNLGAYCASKAALFSATETLRIELKKQGTSVYAVFPGPVDTEMAKDVPMTKAKPDDVARIIFEGVRLGLEDIFPDEMARNIGSQWFKDPKSVERSFGETQF